MTRRPRAPRGEGRRPRKVRACFQLDIHLPVLLKQASAITRRTVSDIARECIEKGCMAIIATGAIEHQARVEAKAERAERWREEAKANSPADPDCRAASSES